MKLWAPDHPRGCAICLRDGRVFCVPCDKAGIEVPRAFCRLAVARGCIPVGMEPDETGPDTLDRMTTIRGTSRRALATLRAPGGPTCRAVLPRDKAVDPEGLVVTETTDKAPVADNTSDAIGDPIADAIMRRLQQAGEVGLSRTALRDAFGRNLRGIGAALEQLRREGKATRERMSVGRFGGRPPEVWRAVE